MMSALVIAISCLISFVLFWKIIPIIVYKCKISKIRKTIGRGISCSTLGYYYIFDVNELGEETFTVYARTDKGLEPMQEINIPNDASTDEATGFYLAAMELVKRFEGLK